MPGRRRTSLPSGVVTFVFTDIEGSTRLLHELGESYVELLAEHYAVVRDVISKHTGHEVQTEGDAFFLAFSRATDAALAAAALQRAVQRQVWPSGEGPVRLKVRIGMHTGEAAPIGGDYVSLAVHRAARIVSAAHGGQVLMSGETAEAIRPSEIPLRTRDLGLYRLKDFDEPERLFQLEVPGLPSEFGEPRAPVAARHNLPRQRTSFVGRRSVTVELLGHVRDRALVTLLGPGGAGKTRLAQEVGSQALPYFEHGVWFVDLAPLTDPEFVVAATARAVGVEESGTRALLDDISTHLEHKSLLLILDNCEQVAEAAGELVDRVLSEAPQVRILATSRSPLRVRGEQHWPLAPLTVPGSGELGAVLESESGQLFVSRAGLVRPDWQVSTDEIGDLAELCRLLDGLPLALELAAARMRTHTPSQLVASLDEHLDLLSSNNVGEGPRQQTMRSLIEWSFQLLDQEERDAFARVSVFRGGFTLDAAMRVVGRGLSDKGTVGACLDSLVEKSLIEVATDDGASRYSMLVSIRRYASEVLTLWGEEVDARAEHMRWILDVVEQSRAVPIGAMPAAVLDELEREHDNIRGGLDHALAADPSAALRLAAGAADFRFLRGHTAEARASLRAAIERAGKEQSLELAYAELALGRELSHNVGFRSEGRDLLLAALDIFALREEAAGEAAALLPLAEDARMAGDVDEALALLHGARDAAARASDLDAEAMALIRLAYLTCDTGRYAESLDTSERALQLATQIGNRRSVGIALHSRSITMWVLGRHEEAGELALEALSTFRAIGDLRSVALASMRVAASARAAGRRDEAMAHLHACLVLCEQLNGRTWLPEALLELALLQATTHPRDAALTIGMARAMATATGYQLDSDSERDLQSTQQICLDALGEEMYRLIAAGERMRDEAILSTALVATDGSSGMKHESQDA